MEAGAGGGRGTSPWTTCRGPAVCSSGGGGEEEGGREGEPAGREGGEEKNLEIAFRIMKGLTKV